MTANIAGMIDDDNEVIRNFVCQPYVRRNAERVKVSTSNANLRANGKSNAVITSKTYNIRNLFKGLEKKTIILNLVRLQNFPQKMEGTKQQQWVI